MVKPTESKKTGLVSAHQPRDQPHQCVGSFHFSILSRQAVTHKNTKEAGARNKEALPSKSPISRLVGYGFWMPVWSASDFGSKQGEGGPINFFAPLWQLLHISRMSGPGSNSGQAWWPPSPQTEMRRQLPELGLVDSTSFVAGPAYFLSHTQGPGAWETLGAFSTPGCQVSRDSVAPQSLSSPKRELTPYLTIWEWVWL